MLRWRFILGTLFVVAFLVVCGFDVHATRPGTFLLPLAVALSLLSAGEVLAMFRKRGQSPLAWPIYVGTAATVLAAAAPAFFPQCAANHEVGYLGWLGLGLAGAFALSLIAEMARFDGSGSSTTNVALSFLAIAYAGGLMGFLVELRLILYEADAVGSGPERHWAMHMFLVTIFTVKMSDIGQYTVGRIIGTHKLAPRISPGKTWEGALGGIVLACVTTWILFRFVPTPESASFLRTMIYAVALAVAGMIGDLAESLFKRDAGVKDSSVWLPGFGGVLDLLDSLLGAAPVAYLFWAMHWIG